MMRHAIIIIATLVALTAYFWPQRKPATDLVFTQNEVEWNSDFHQIVPGSQYRGATWIVDDWMQGMKGPHGERLQGRAHWQVPDGYRVSFPEGDFNRPLAVRLAAPNQEVK